MSSPSLRQTPAARTLSHSSDGGSGGGDKAARTSSPTATGAVPFESPTPVRCHCPGDLTHAEREEQCVSVQEHTWGTDGLARLEAIKAKVDPQGLFQCQKCVGFKGPVRDQ